MKDKRKELIIGVIAIGIIVLAAITVAIILLTSKDKPSGDEIAKSLTLDQTSISEEIVIGQESIAVLTAITKNITEELVWASSNEDVATVDASGETAVVTLKSAGSATITVKAGNLGALCQVAVKEVESKITLSQTTLVEGIVKGKTKVVTLTATLENLEGNVEWTVDNDKVASIIGNGETAELTLKGIGEAVVTAKVGEKSATCNVKVSDETSMITLNITNINKQIARGSTSVHTLEATLLNIKDELKWTTSNPQVAKVERIDATKAKVTLVGAGKATITVTDGKVNATCSVTVTHPQVKFNLDNNNITKTKILGVDKTFKNVLKATLQNASGTINWVSSNTAVATVNKTGTTATIVAKKAGTTTITATCKVDGKTYSAKCTVEIKDIVPKITLNSKASQTLGFGDIATIEVSVDPKDVNLKWDITKASNVTIVEQTNTRLKLKSTSEGNASVTVSYGNDKVTATAQWKKPDITDIKGLKDIYYIEEGKTISDVMNASVSNLGNQVVNWTCTSGGKITQKGTSATLTVSKTGTYTITASVLDDTVTKTINVYAAKLDVESSNNGTYVGQTGTLKVRATGFISTYASWSGGSGSLILSDKKSTLNSDGSYTYSCNYQVISGDRSEVTVVFKLGNRTQEISVATKKPVVDLVASVITLSSQSNQPTITITANTTPKDVGYTYKWSIIDGDTDQIVTETAKGNVYKIDTKRNKDVKYTIQCEVWYNGKYILNKSCNVIWHGF